MSNYVRWIRIESIAMRGNPNTYFRQVETEISFKQKK